MEPSQWHSHRTARPLLNVGELTMSAAQEGLQYLLNDEWIWSCYITPHPCYVQRGVTRVVHQTTSHLGVALTCFDCWQVDYTGTGRTPGDDIGPLGNDVGYATQLAVFTKKCEDGVEIEKRSEPAASSSTPSQNVDSVRMIWDSLSTVSSAPAPV